MKRISISCLLLIYGLGSHLMGCTPKAGGTSTTFEILNEVKLIGTVQRNYGGHKDNYLLYQHRYVTLYQDGGSDFSAWTEQEAYISGESGSKMSAMAEEFYNIQGKYYAHDFLGITPDLKPGYRITESFYSTPSDSIDPTIQGFFVVESTCTSSPTIDSHPADTDVTWGGIATFRVRASGVGVLRYQWYQEVGDSMEIMPGETGLSLAIYRYGQEQAAALSSVWGLAAVGTTRVQVRVSNANGSAVSNPATVRLTTPGNTVLTNLGGSQEIRGRIWNDTIPDNLDNGDPGLANALVCLDDVSTPTGEPACVRTDSGGNYVFLGVTPGSYSITIKLDNPKLYEEVARLKEPPSQVSRIFSNQITEIAVGEGSNALNINGGYFALPHVRFGRPTTVVDEGDSGFQDITIPISLDRPRRSEDTFPWIAYTIFTNLDYLPTLFRSRDFATVNNDYTVIGEPSFQVGQQHSELVIRVIGDTVIEANEKVSIYLWDNFDYLASEINAIHTLTITNDDIPAVDDVIVYPLEQGSVHTIGATGWKPDPSLGKGGFSADASTLGFANMLVLPTPPANTVIFEWKMTGTPADSLQLATGDLTPIKSISGNTGWQRMQATLPAGSVVFNLTLWKANTSGASVKAWIRGLQFVDASNLGNQPPVVTSTPPSQVASASNYLYPITLDDPDHSSDALSVTAVQLPAWLSLQQSPQGAWSLSGEVPTLEKATAFPVRLQISDPAKNIVDYNYSILVDWDQASEYQLWQQSYFAEDTANPSLTDMNADPDRDRFNNLFEFMAGTNPLVKNHPEDLRLKPAIVTPQASADSFGLQFVTPASPPDGMSLQVEKWSAEEKRWQAISTRSNRQAGWSGSAYVTTQEIPIASKQLVTIRENTRASSKSLSLLRLKISYASP